MHIRQILSAIQAMQETDFVEIQSYLEAVATSLPDEEPTPPQQAVAIETALARNTESLYQELGQKFTPDDVIECLARNLAAEALSLVEIEQALDKVQRILQCYEGDSGDIVVNLTPFHAALTYYRDNYDKLTKEVAEQKAKRKEQQQQLPSKFANLLNFLEPISSIDLLDTRLHIQDLQHQLTHVLNTQPESIQKEYWLAQGFSDQVVIMNFMEEFLSTLDMLKFAYPNSLESADSLMEYFSQYVSQNPELASEENIEKFRRLYELYQDYSSMYVFDTKLVTKYDTDGTPYTEEEPSKEETDQKSIVGTLFNFRVALINKNSTQTKNTREILSRFDNISSELDEIETAITKLDSILQSSPREKREAIWKDQGFSTIASINLLLNDLQEYLGNMRSKLGKHIVGLEDLLEVLVKEIPVDMTQSTSNNIRRLKDLYLKYDDLSPMIGTLQPGSKCYMFSEEQLVLDRAHKQNIRNLQALDVACSARVVAEEKKKTLDNACEVYRFKLQRRIIKAIKDIDLDLYNNLIRVNSGYWSQTHNGKMVYQQDKPIDKIIHFIHLSVDLNAHPKLQLNMKKYTAVKAMHESLHNNADSPQQLQNFERIYNAKNNLIKTDKDSAAMVFIKVVASILLSLIPVAGLAGIFALWRTPEDKKGVRLDTEIKQTLSR